MVGQRSFLMYNPFAFLSFFLFQGTILSHAMVLGLHTEVSIVSLQVCYSWWVLSSLIMIDRAHWIDKDKLIKFIIDCQVSSKLNELLLSFSLIS